MSDDFDKDDLWDDDDQPDKDQPGDDEEIFDWQEGGKPGDKSRTAADRLGFTGELSWLQDDDAGNAPGQGEDHLGLTGELPWLQGDDDTPATGPRDSAAGLTGALPWMQGATGSEGQPSDSDDDFSWLDDDDETPATDMNTGTLFMPPADDFEDEPPVEDPRWTGEHVTADLDMPEWMRDSGPDWIDDEGDSANWEAPAASTPWDSDSAADDDSPLDEDAPDWLTGIADSPAYSADEPTDIPEIPPTEKESPEWLQKLDTSKFGEPPPVDEDDPLNTVPDWLAGMEDDEPAQEDTSFTQGGQLSADWLAQGETLPETSESELTFDEWLQHQEAQEREPELDELVPDTFEDFTGLADEPPVTAADIDTGMLPDWFLGMEELDTSDAPDWFTGDADEDLSAEPVKDSTEPNKPTGPLPDIFGFDDFPDDTTESDPFSALDEPAEPVTLEDFLTPVEVEDLDDLVEVDDDDEDQPAPAAEVDLDDDFFANLGSADESPEPDFADFDFPEAETEPETDDEYADDFFSSLGAAAPADDLPEPSFADFGADFMSNLGMDDEPDEPAADALPAADLEPLGDDFFASLGLDEPEEAAAPRAGSSADDDLDALFDQPASEPEFHDESTIPDGDFLSSLGIADEAEPADEPIDWFAEAESEITTDAEAMNWLDDIDEYDADAAEPVDADFMAALGASTPDQPAPEAEYDDIDSILASIDRVDAILPDSSPLTEDNVDFDTLMSDPAFSDLQGQREDTPDDSPPREDWLTELGASVGTVSAAAIVRQQQDRPVDQLSDRLQRLRDKAEATPATEEAASSAIFSDLLPGISTTLAASTIELDASSIASTVVITPEQQKRIDLLKSLAATEADLEQPALSAIDRTYDSPYMLDDDDDLPGLLDDDQPAEVVAAPVVSPREPRRVRVDRLLIALLVAAAVIAPFFLGAARIGQPPPASFAVGSPAQAFYDTVARLRPGQFVLVGMEYGPTAAGELDTTASVVLRHILQQGARPVVVSSNPVALLRADNLLAEIATDSTPALTANSDYYIIRYLAGNSVGLRGFSQNPLALLATDIQGAPTGLTRVDDLADFSAVVVIAERAEDLRTWAEQVAPLTPVSFLGVTGFSAAPMTEPYLGAALDGLLIGYQDALTYDTLLTSGAEALPEAAETDDSTVPDTDTGSGAADLTPTVEQTPSPVPPSPTPTPLALGIINASNAINVRSGAGSGFAVVTSIDPGAEVTVLSLDDTSGWVNVRLPDGTEGWVSSSLIVVLPTGATATTTAPESPEAEETAQPTGTAVPSATLRPTQTTAPTQANTVTVAPSSTPTTGPTNTPAPTNTPVATTITARVIASESINVRSGPATNFAPVGTAAPGDEFVVIGRNGAGDWISIEFGDAEEAWIAAFLLEISAEEIPPADDDTSQAERDLILVAGADLRLVPYRAQAETTPEAEATAEATTEPVAATPAIEATASQYTIPYAEERWYSMNLGLVAIIIIIVLGALINIGRALFRRRG